ncbi:hypothetical protein ABD91_00600 [Lysinibacillus sphaericus]|uniref:hypothetical protein n=1 Tax=Lysinibacillus sphaericus TaxID=1421 RepID=UPI0018CC94FF|nr:hypothetical protein [Lysinibacillus sphaericus]MBG9689427.1 hypothetical protein [Lysinibacillus sphaericus]
MKAYELMCKIKGLEPDMNSKNMIKNQAYSHRVFVNDLLDDDNYKQLHKTVEWFLENDDEFDGEGLAEWSRFLEVDVIC